MEHRDDVPGDDSQTRTARTDREGWVLALEKVQTLTQERDAAITQLTALDRQLHRLQCGEEIESDRLCDASLRIQVELDQARARADKAEQNLVRYKAAAANALHKDMDAVLHRHDADTYENRLQTECRERMNNEGSLYQRAVTAEHQALALGEIVRNTHRELTGWNHNEDCPRTYHEDCGWAESEDGDRLWECTDGSPREQCEAEECDCGLTAARQLLDPDALRTSGRNDLAAVLTQVLDTKEEEPHTP